MNDTMPDPDVFAYLDYRAFLRDWFEGRKRSNARYSHRVFARLAGFKSSSVLLHVMRGERNLSPESTEAFGKAMHLPGDAREFFRALVALDQARNDDERNQAWARVSAQRRFREARSLDGAAFQFLSSWAWPAIHQLAAREDFRADPEWIAARLRPTITAAEASEALEALTSLGLLAADADGRLRPSDTSVVTPPEVTDLAACNYHREMSTRALEAVSAFDADERHLLGLTVAVPMAILPIVKQELHRMQARLLDLCDAATGPRDRVYQVNLQLFPLSDIREAWVAPEDAPCDEEGGDEDAQSSDPMSDDAAGRDERLPYVPLPQGKVL